MWAAVDKPEQFEEILNSSFKSKWYLKEHPLCCFDCMNEINFLRKRLEIGDISITILASNDNPFVTILTDDEGFARISDKEYGFLVIYYDSIRLGTFDLNPDNISKELLTEPIKIETP